MAETRLDKVGDDTTTVYDVVFQLGFLSRAHIFVYLENSSPYNQLNYSWINSTQIELDVAAEVGVKFSIRRIVPRNVAINDYEAGAILREDNLDDSFAQALMIQQEIADGYSSVEGPFGMGNDLDMRNNSILNVKEAYQNSSAPTWGQVKELVLTNVELGEDTARNAYQLPWTGGISIGEGLDTEIADRQAAIVGVQAEVVNEAAERILEDDKLRATSRSSIYLYGGSPYKTGEENLAALRLAKAASGSVYLPSVEAGSSTYLINGMTPTDMSGLVWYADETCVVSLDSNVYNLNTGAQFATAVKFHFRDLNFDFVAVQNYTAGRGGVKIGVRQAKSELDGVSEIVEDSQIVGLEIVTETDGEFTPVAVGGTGYYRTVDANFGKTAGAFVNIAVGETISAHITNRVFSSNRVGICVKSDSGYYNILKDPTVVGGVLELYSRVGASVATGTLSYPHRSVASHYELQNSTMSVTRISKTEWLVSINGEALEQVFSSIGDITEVGFICKSVPTANINVEITGISRQTSNHVTGIPQMRQVLVYGDSTADDFHGAFAQHLKQSMAGANGGLVFDIVNRAVAGTTIEEAYAQMVADTGLYIAKDLVLVAGTNNIQGLSPVASTIATLNLIFAWANDKGIKVVVVEPYMWYPANISGVGNGGQNTASFERGGATRSAMQYETARAGHTYVRTTQLLPRPDFLLLASDNDPLLRDNIHQSALTYQLYAEMIADALVYNRSKVTQGWVALPKRWLSAGWTVTNGLYRKLGNGIEVTGAFKGPTPIANGTTFLTIPYKCAIVTQSAASRKVLTSTCDACIVDVSESGIVTVSLVQSTAHDEVVVTLRV
jgi:lysophospholipase L1-like esterase